MESLLQDSGGRFAEENPAHIDLDDLPRDPVFLHAVADIVELSEGGAQLVEVVAQSVGKEVVQDPRDDLRESDDALGQLELFLVRDFDFRVQSRRSDLFTGHIRQTSYRPMKS